MKRQGVTLLEVMFAIGVVVIGLLGVIAVIPVALHQIGQGTTLDRASRIGLNAVEDFQVTGMAKSSLWRFRNGSSVTGTPASLRNGARTAFAIDPHFIAVNNSDANADQFPYGSALGGVPRMNRITLQRAFNDANIMTAAQAELMFVGSDDLVFDLPDDRSQPPVQFFGGQTSKRQFDGTVSWMATVAPVLDTSDEYRDLYTLSIVVFHKRAVADTGAEHVADVRDFDGNGLSGGDITLQGTSAEELDVQSGDWVMLMDFMNSTINTADTTKNTPYFRWYRVVSTEESSQPAGGPWQRNVTLHGPDWPANRVTNTRFYWSNSPPPAGSRPTRIAIIDNVVAVYEKTIRLENQNLWAF